MKRFKSMLYVVETGKRCTSVLRRAVALAETNQANLTLVDVVPQVPAGIGMPRGGPLSADLQTALRTEHAQALDALAEPYRQRAEIQCKVLVGTPYLEVIREVLREGHDLVIKAPEDPSWLALLFGSNDMHLLRKCPCPICITKCDAPTAFRRILAAVDLADDDPTEGSRAHRSLSHQILEVAAWMALTELAELHLVTVWEAIGEGVMRSASINVQAQEVFAYVEAVRRQHEAGLDALLHALEDTLGPEALTLLKPRKHLIRGAPSKEIPAQAKRLEADLVVMGTVGRSGIPGLLIGNTAETILYQLDCSVLAIKPPGFVSPVSIEPSPQTSPPTPGPT
ncbi:universal stress protein [Thiorhodococcus minor]|uniref:Universal stress protein n=1 Tax=Thiorhodococcus minor TaxID=57489 RepID=A0A6M0K2Q1_9GAMM|nr:universal stress protein [Thiorhodococcus minor]NEV63233.1 universal stress protein [Thiorhodococcus minor]